ncbi:branched-chain amino acid transport system II carrier protein [Thiopseudomonas acetoxidans]|uniref:Branched-chain amino acid transport system carrier protein n=1 Tax=Thiopseudomonas acetoxidans TaxID=3041622 RepID=A0ABT7SL92_9GAMM|nr:branched-chain amino acid transport system II carrier protein [Thiopseudomonas sp. CY1220]MDM7856962.1 branched-chain amino acid transport system II carrier protein [Thiopseudomonas sp. CY1220]
MKSLSKSQIMALGFMTFALFLGAGNIIFPAAAGVQSGSQLWLVAVGFLLTGVGLPLATVIALAKVGGGLQTLTAPIGVRAGTVFAIMVYLAIGPFFATPRTAVVAYEIGIVPFFGEHWWLLLLFSSLYFATVLYLALNPNKILVRIGQFITPVLLAALVLLGLATLFNPAGSLGEASGHYASQPMTQGFLDGYLTMDALGALVFGVVIAGTIRSQGVTELKQITRYSIYAGLIAALGLSVVYVSLFYLGATSHQIAADATNGGQVLAIYVHYAFGDWGILLLSVVITLACLTTATGLLAACGEYFKWLWGIRYQRTVVFFALFSLVVANQGLTQLIKVSVPALVGLYPLAIVLVLLSFLKPIWHNPGRVFKSVLLMTLVFGLVDALVVAGVDWQLLTVFQQLPLAHKQMAWVLPACALVVVLTLLDRKHPNVNKQAHTPLD